MNYRFVFFVFCVLSYRISLIAAQKLVSRGKTITASSQQNDWVAEKAIDGNTDRSPDTCNCCAATRQEHEPWYKLDLGQLYKIHSISVLGRGGPEDGSGGYGHTLLNMEIKLGTTESDGQALTKNTDDVYVYNYTLPTPQEGRYLTLTLREMSQYFVICELLIFAVCDGNTFGPACIQICGRCKNGEPCDTVDGTCSDCMTGHKLPLCKDCTDSYFGNDCTQRCFCLNSPCDKTTGICPTGGCSEGYKGDQCNTPCEYGKYGQNCEEGCGACYSIVTCDRFNGSCQACAPGYRGVQCTQICGSGSYGQGCTKECGHCFNNEDCNHIDGHCTKCAAGYNGADCKTECDSRTFGLNCSQKCGHCLDSIQCNTVNGSCPAGCDPGFEGALCDAACGTGKYGDNCANDCGHYYEGESCDAVTGLCHNNCSEGYTGTYCKQECPDGKFGRNCMWTCENAGHKAESSEVKIYQLATALVGTIALASIIGNVVTAVCYVTRKRRKQKDKPINSPADISGPYEMTNESVIETQHQYEQTATVYEEADAPYEIPK